jgi:RNA 2',3'-cyclic 3'-phosphodiesterase
MRLFFALWPPPATAQALEDWTRKVRKQTGGKPMRAENIHLTLAFLGEADRKTAFTAAKRVRGTPHALPIEQAQHWKHNDIVWAGPRSTPAELQDLVKQLDQALSEESFVLEKRPFAAHVTLLRKARAPKSLPPLPRVEWPVTEFLLVHSHAVREGSTYEPLERFTLVR